jgi:high mobility group protein B3
VTSAAIEVALNKLIYFSLLLNEVPATRTFIDKMDELGENEIEQKRETLGTNKLEPSVASSSSGTQQRVRPPKQAFMIFCDCRREEIKRNNPDLRFAEIVKKLVDEWRSLDDKAKEPFLVAAEQDRKRYEEEKLKFQQEYVENDTTKKHMAYDNDDGKDSLFGFGK